MRIAIKGDANQGMMPQPLSPDTFAKHLSAGAFEIASPGVVSLPDGALGLRTERVSFTPYRNKPTSRVYERVAKALGCEIEGLI